MAAQTSAPLEPQFPRQPNKAGYWLIATLPLAVLIMFPLNAWIHRQSVINMIGLPLVVLAFAGTAYQWANALIHRNDWRANWRTGLAGSIGLSVTILGVEFGVFEPLFDTLLKLMNITLTLCGTHDEFYVVFVELTGTVTGDSGLAIGLALNQPKLAMQLLGLGIGCGLVVFFVVALALGILGFRVGMPRPDELPSMPIVNLLGIWVTALIGSELFGWVMARHNSLLESE